MEKRGGWGELLFYVGQFRIAAIRRCPFRVFLKEVRDSHVLMAVGRAFHILVDNTLTCLQQGPSLLIHHAMKKADLQFVLSL